MKRTLIVSIFFMAFAMAAFAQTTTKEVSNRLSDGCTETYQETTESKTDVKTDGGKVTTTTVVTVYKNGTYMIYYPPKSKNDSRGNRKVNGSYKNGLKFASWGYFNDNNGPDALYKEEIYDNAGNINQIKYFSGLNHVNKVEEYDSTGKLVKTTNYDNMGRVIK